MLSSGHFMSVAAFFLLLIMLMLGPTTRVGSAPERLGTRTAVISASKAAGGEGRIISLIHSRRECQGALPPIRLKIPPGWTSVKNQSHTILVPGVLERRS